MITKYKVNEVAKDFGIQNKEVTEILGKFFDEPKKSQTALDTKELDVLFDVLTQENSVSSFDAYFAMQKKEAKKPEKKEPQKKAPEKKEIPETKDAGKKDDRKPAPEKKQEKRDDGSKKQGDRPEGKKPE